MLVRKVGMTICVAMAIGFITYAIADDAKPFKANCPVSGKAALQDKTADYNGGTVYFCCGNCPGAFAKDTAKYAAKANLQLAETGQAVEEKCPLSGQKLNPNTTVEVSGVKVQFCCEKCQAKVSEAKGDDQINLVFKDEPFKKAFKVTKK